MHTLNRSSSECFDNRPYIDPRYEALVDEGLGKSALGLATLEYTELPIADYSKAILQRQVNTAVSRNSKAA